MTIRRAALTFAALLFGWIAIMALVMRFSDAAPAAVVPFPPGDFISRLPEGVAVISANNWSISLRGDVDQLGLKLYQSGAWLVLPAGLTGCLPLPGEFKAQN